MAIDPQKLAMLQAMRAAQGGQGAPPGMAPSAGPPMAPQGQPMPSQQVAPPPEPPPSVQRLVQFTTRRNLAEYIAADELSKIGSRVWDDWQTDKRSRTEWDQMVDEARKHATQVKESKSWPWPNAANIKYPLITVGAIQFAARAYPEIVTGSKLVKCEVQGEVTEAKEERAKRVSRHMSWQLIRKQSEWEEETDRLLFDLPIVGMGFRKTFYDAIRGCPVSKYYPAEDIYVNHKTQRLEDAARITHIYEIWENDVVKNMRQKLWIDVDLSPVSSDSDEDDPPRTILEQHRWLDLDEDGLKEPYIVTIDEESHKVLRILARFEPDKIKVNENGEIYDIEPTQYFTRYYFLPNPDGGFYGIGLGRLLLPLNEAINGIINQLLDAGTLANAGGGLISREARSLTRISKPITKQLGKYLPVDISGADLKRAIHEWPVPQPSPVLFQLLGLMIEAAKEISGAKDVLQGKMPQGANIPATTVVAIIEQGLKEYSAIHKRIHNSLTDEYQKRYKLNSKHLNKDEYFTLQDEPTQQQVMVADYNPADMDIVPVADPQYSSDVLKLAKAQALLQIQSLPGARAPGITRRYVEALDVPNIDAVVLTQQEVEAQQQQGQKMQQLTLAVQLKTQQMDILKTQAEVEQKKARAMLDVAKSKGEDSATSLEAMKMFVDSLDGIITGLDDMKNDLQQGGQHGGNAGGTGVPGMAGPQSNPGTPQGIGGGA